MLNFFYVVDKTKLWFVLDSDQTYTSKVTENLTSVKISDYYKCSMSNPPTFKRVVGLTGNSCW